MKHIDLVDRLIPKPATTLVVEVSSKDFVLVDTERAPAKGDSVLVKDIFMPYQAGLTIVGVAYCAIKFL